MTTCMALLLSCKFNFWLPINVYLDHLSVSLSLSPSLPLSFSLSLSPSLPPSLSLSLSLWDATHLFLSLPDCDTPPSLTTANPCVECDTHKRAVLYGGREGCRLNVPSSAALPVTGHAPEFHFLNALFWPWSGTASQRVRHSGMPVRLTENPGERRSLISGGGDCADVCALHHVVTSLLPVLAQFRCGIQKRWHQRGGLLSCNPRPGLDSSSLKKILKPKFLT